MLVSVRVVRKKIGPSYKQRSVCFFSRNVHFNTPPPPDYCNLSFSSVFFALYKQQIDILICMLLLLSSSSRTQQHPLRVLLQRRTAFLHFDTPIIINHPTNTICCGSYKVLLSNHFFTCPSKQSRLGFLYTAR